MSRPGVAALLTQQQLLSGMCGAAPAQLLGKTACSCCWCSALMLPACQCCLVCEHYCSRCSRTAVETARPGRLSVKPVGVQQQQQHKQSDPKKGQQQQQQQERSISKAGSTAHSTCSAAAGTGSKRCAPGGALSIANAAVLVGYPKKTCDRRLFFMHTCPPHLLLVLLLLCFELTGDAVDYPAVLDQHHRRQLAH